jgi:hypothetical protein
MNFAEGISGALGIGANKYHFLAILFVLKQNRVIKFARIKLLIVKS